MPVEFQCTHCGHALRVSRKYAGRLGSCKHCGERLVAPMESAPVEPVKTSRRAWRGWPVVALLGLVGVCAAILVLARLYLTADDSNDTPASVAVEPAMREREEPVAAQAPAPAALPLADRIAALLPTSREDRWLDIDWRMDLLRARVEASKAGKPMFMWLMNGDPLGCT